MIYRFGKLHAELPQRLTFVLIYANNVYQAIEELKKQRPEDYGQFSVFETTEIDKPIVIWEVEQ